MNKISYASVIGSLINAMICTCHDVSYVLNMMNKDINLIQVMITGRQSIIFLST